MKKNRRIVIIALFVLLISLSLYFDSEIVKGFSLIRNSFLDNIFIGIVFISSEIIIFFFLTSILLWQEHKRRWILPLWVTLGVSALVGFLLKISIQRLRPFQAGIVSISSFLEANKFSLLDFSFPSGHSTIVFCAIPILSKEFPKLKYVWIGFAGLVAFSRVYFGIHFLSDVIAGGLIGYLIGTIIIKYEKENRFGERVYKRLFEK